MQGLMPIAGFNYGAKNWIRVRKAINISIKWTTGISLLLLSVIVLFPEDLIAIFTEDKYLLKHTPRVLKLIFISLPIMGIGFIGGAYFQAVGKPIPALILTLARQGLIMIPLMYILAHFFGLDGVWISLPAGEVVAGVWAAVWLYMEVNRLTNKKSPLDKRAL